MHVPVSQAELAGQAGRVEAEAKAKSWAGWNVCGPEPRHAHNVRRVALIPNEAGACTARQSHARNQSRNLHRPGSSGVARGAGVAGSHCVAP